MLGWNGEEAAIVGEYDILAIGVQEAKDIDKWERLLVGGMAASQQGRFHHIQSVRLDPVRALSPPAGQG